MKKSLIIVESPAKMKTLKKFLGKNYIFESSVGHIRDLPSKKFGIDLENETFEPDYEILEGKKQVIESLKKAAKSADTVYLSPDPDREGEAIAWHIAAILPKGTKYKRVTFNAITKNAVIEALEHPRDIDKNLVNAQQARRLLDRIVGYKISPILHQKIGRTSDGSLSAGRVQSVALKLVVDREKEIEAFVPTEYWLLGSSVKQQKNQAKPFEASLYSVNGKRALKEKTKGKDAFTISDEKTANEILNRIKTSNLTIAKVERKEKKRNPVPPFITSTLQQEAARHFGYGASKTMSIAQGLYEGVDLGDRGSEGLITYMRTDSVRTSPEANRAARKIIEQKYGKNFLPIKPVNYATKNRSQDAHEAIRPTYPDIDPDSIRNHLSNEQYKLYKLIYQRFLASQMSQAVYDTVSCNIDSDQNLTLRATGSVIKFQGFLAVYEEKNDSSEEQGDSTLPADLKEGEILSIVKPFANQSFTKPPARFTEASLVKELEKSGIGRPSTYASIMQKIQSRSYTTKEKNTLKPTELGRIICRMLEENFPKIMNVKFTAEMESELDKIAETDVDWKAFLRNFWHDFAPTVEEAKKHAHVPKIDTDKKCPECGGTLQKIWAKNKYFYGCANYPDCKYTAPLQELTYNKDDYAEGFDWDQKCPKCGGEMKVRQSRYGIFLGCANYPDCKTIVNIPRKGEALPEDLPKCPAIGCDGDIVQRRSRFGKTFYSCSTFPDCDVIANSIDELKTKYTDHKKTAYAGKKGAGKKKGAAKGKTSEKGAKKKTTKRAQAQYSLSKELKALVGDENLSRGEITKRLWDYIKTHKLQDEKNKRLIVPDEKLAKFFGHKESIDMMKLAGYISKHLS